MTAPVVSSEFHLHGSPLLRGFSATAHVGLLVLMAVALWSRWPLVLLGAAPVLIGHAVFADRQLALRASNAIRALRHDAEGWSVAGAMGEWQPIQLTAGTTVTSRVIVLGWSVGFARSHHLLVTPDMLPDGEFRRLCRLLWQATPALARDTQSV